MTNEQYKGVLLDQLADLQRILELLKAGGTADVQTEVEKQIAKVNEKLKF